jgi:hypothetical protein
VVAVDMPIHVGNLQVGFVDGGFKRHKTVSAQKS